MMRGGGSLPVDQLEDPGASGRVVVTMEGSSLTEYVSADDESAIVAALVFNRGYPSAEDSVFSILFASEGERDVRLLVEGVLESVDESILRRTIDDLEAVVGGHASHLSSMLISPQHHRRRSISLPIDHHAYTWNYIIIIPKYTSNVNKHHSVDAKRTVV